MSSPGFSDPDGLEDPSAEAEEAEEAEEEVSLEATLPGAISQAERPDDCTLHFLDCPSLWPTTQRWSGLAVCLMFISLMRLDA
ncbi:hypothetical protein JEQ12_008571 [Ovis aries]|uniref:Uncharacterized protein n=1 Tax=Ovis aries TaxID=9940 RepID=A0A835ZY43_SHEEP|nr:hypothetical protein JEQ12_008571 [Ovis aries]